LLIPSPHSLPRPSLALFLSPGSTTSKTTTPFQKQRVKARKKSISRRGRGRRRRRQRGCCQFPSSSETACEKDDSGQSNRWIVLIFVGWVSYVFGYDLTVGIIDMISGSSRKVAGQKGCDTVFL
ncbi:unnamed protein product, partial [Linum tenue]